MPFPIPAARWRQPVAPRVVSIRSGCSEPGRRRFFACCFQVLTRFLGSSSPMLYWFSAHLLQGHEAWLWKEGADGQSAGRVRERCVLCAAPGSCGKGPAGGHPLLRLLLSYRSMTAVGRGVLGYFASYWLLGLVLHCNCLPWT